MEEEKQSGVSLLTLWKVFIRVWYWMILAAVLLGAAAGLGTNLFVSPTSASSTVSMGNNIRVSGVDDAATTTELSAAKELASTFCDVIRLKTQVRGALELANADPTLEDIPFTENTLRKYVSMISTSSETGSELFTVRVSGTDPDLVYRVSRALEAYLPGRLQELTYNYEGENVDLKKQLVVIVDHSERDTVADAPNVTRIAILGAVSGAILCYLVFFLITVLDKTVYRKEDLVRLHPDIPVLGSIPSWYGENVSRRAKHEDLAGERNIRGKVLSSKTSFRVSEGFRSLRTNLLYARTKEEGVAAVYACTSAQSGEGKSIVTVNTAVAFAMLEQKVLLIDADLRLPTCGKFLPLPDEAKGLSDYLSGQVTLEECLFRNVYEGLDVLPAGYIPPNPVELLSSDKMKALLAKLRLSYDMILIDVPPVGELIDAGVLAEAVDGYLMVVRSSFSRSDAIESAMSALLRVNGKLVGFVINDVFDKHAKHNKKHGDYGYGYGYGYSSVNGVSDRQTKEGQTEDKTEGGTSGN